MFHPPLQLWNMTPACWYEEWIPAFETKSPRKLLCISYSEHKTNHWEQSKINFLVDPQDPLLAFVKRWRFARFRHFICHDSLSFRAPWRVGNAMVGRGNAGWTTSNSGHPCPCQNCSWWPPAGKTGRKSLLNCLSCLLQWPNQSRDWSELKWAKGRWISYLI